MKCGFISIDWDNRALKELGEELLSSGFSWMEIHYPRYTNSDAFFEEYWETNQYLIERYQPGLSIHLPAGDINPASFNRRFRRESLDQLREAIDLGAEIGASLVVMHPGELREADFPEEERQSECDDIRQSIAEAVERAWKLNLEGVIECAGTAKAKNITLTVENMFNAETLIKKPEQARKFLAEIDSYGVGLTLDAGHAYRARIQPADFVKNLGEKVFHLHLNDNDGSCDLHLPLGKGSINFASLLKALEAVNYQGALVLEISSSRAKDFIESRLFLQNLLQ